MSEAEAKRNLIAIMEVFRPGSVLHLLADTVREAESARTGGLDEAADERVREAEAFLWVAGYGLLAALPM